MSVCAKPKGYGPHLLGEGGTQSFPLRKENNLKWEVPLIWLMKQESKLLWSAPSASRETMTRKRTRRTTLTDSNSRSTVVSAVSTLFTKNLSDLEEE